MGEAKRADGNGRGAPDEVTAKRRVGKVERRIKKILREMAEEEMAGKATLWIHYDNGAPPVRAVPKHIAESAVAALRGEFDGDRKRVGLRVVRGGRA